MPEPPLNVAIVGPGRIADRHLAPALSSVPGARLWSVLSRDEARADAFARKHAASSARPAHADMDRLLADPRLDAVIIATPDRLHAQQAIAAAAAGKHVFVEKPMSTDVASGREMIDACATANVRLGVAYHLRWHAGLRRVAELAREGDLGELRHARLHWTWRAPDASNWRASPDVGRWWALAGVGTHLLDLARWWMGATCGEVVALRSLVTHTVFNRPHDETALVLLRFESGATAELTSSVLFDSTSRVELYGARGNAVGDGVLGPHGAGTITVRGQELSFPREDPYVGELTDFAAAIREGRDPEVSGPEGLRNVELLVQASVGD